MFLFLVFKRVKVKNPKSTHVELMAHRSHIHKGGQCHYWQRRDDLIRTGAIVLPSLVENWKDSKTIIYAMENPENLKKMKQMKRTAAAATRWWVCTPRLKKTGVGKEKNALTSY
jgi:hypothetical protein